MPGTTSRDVTSMDLYVWCDQSRAQRRYYLGDRMGNELREVDLMRTSEDGVSLRWTFENKTGHELHMEFEVESTGSDCPLLFGSASCVVKRKAFSDQDWWRIDGKPVPGSSLFGGSYDYKIRVKPSDGSASLQTIDPRLQIDKRNNLSLVFLLVAASVAFLIGGALGVLL